MTEMSCGENAGTHAGVNRHNRAWEALCEQCRQFRADYAKHRRRNSETREKARQQSAYRQWALKTLAARHQSEYRDLLRIAREVLP